MYLQPQPAFMNAPLHEASTTIFARLEGPRQWLAYALRGDIAEEISVAIPLPVAEGTTSDDINLDSLHAYPNFFSLVQKPFKLDRVERPHAWRSRGRSRHARGDLSRRLRCVHCAQRRRASPCPPRTGSSSVCARAGAVICYVRIRDSPTENAETRFRSIRASCGSPSSTTPFSSRFQQAHPTSCSSPPSWPTTGRSPSPFVTTTSFSAKPIRTDNLRRGGSGRLARLGCTSLSTSYLRSIRHDTSTGAVSGGRTGMRICNCRNPSHADRRWLTGR